VALDLGGIAKGWSADELARRYLAPFPGYLIDLGGDLRVRGGPSDGEPWIVGIADPRVDAGIAQANQGATYVAGLALTAGGIATSGDARRWWLRDGARQHHLIDPRTGRPATQPDTDPDSRVLTYTALAPTTTEADALAKVAFLLGYPDGLRMLSHGIHRAGVCVFASGRVEASSNLEEYLHAHHAPGATAS
jgi:thiamine biosynthesis lipoprotein